MDLTDDCEGRLVLVGAEWMLDAEPHITVQFERLFPSSRVEYVYGDRDALEFTHRPRFIGDSPRVRKDIDWFLGRYDLRVSPEDRERLRDGARSFDERRAAAKRAFHDPAPVPLSLSLPLRSYQEQAVALALHRGSLLVADQVGLGKTPVGIAVASRGPPALVLVPPHLQSQWRDEIKKFLPGARVFLMRNAKKDRAPPESDFYVMSFHVAAKWVEEFTTRRPIKTLVIDEVHGLRHANTEKYRATAAIAEKASVRVGLSATPIMNYGSELFNILQILEPGALGSENEFSKEWCSDWGKIKDPELLGHYLFKNLIMVRRTRKDVALELAPVNRIVYTVDADMETLRRMEAEMKVLALKVITGGFREAGEAARQLDWRMRHDTGVAKARAVCEIVRMIVESGEKVVLFGWHRDVYDIWLRELADYHPVLFTGSETTSQKEESLQSFVNGTARVFIMSLRSGAGINGLQYVSSYAVFGELDWSPGIHEQCIGRLWRDGQQEQVTAAFITIDDGADPIMKRVIGDKVTESTKIMNPQAEVLAAVSDDDHIYSMAVEWLRSKGEDVDRIVRDRETEERGELFIDPPRPDDGAYPVWHALQKKVFSSTIERDLQHEVELVFRDAGLAYEREVRLSERSRVDFRVGATIVECKPSKFSKTELLKQIKRYHADDPSIQAIVLVTPAPLRHFMLNGTPVYAVNISNSSLMIEGLS